MLSRVSLLMAALVGFATSPAIADIKITVDKAAQTLTVVRDGEVLHKWPVSTGRVGRFTPDGTYQAFRMEKDHYSREFDDAPMPHSIFFTKRGHAIHGSLETGKLGRPASSGCVRLAPENAKVLFDLVKAEGVLKTKVTIAGDERVALARADRQLTRGRPNDGSSRQVERGTGLPPTYSPPVDDEPRARERYAAPRQVYRQQQQQQYYYDGYRWQPHPGQGYQRAQPQPYYGQPQYYYQPRYYYD
jgi:hypothetical protein